jgi:hypothetical protein
MCAPLANDGRNVATNRIGGADEMSGQHMDRAGTSATGCLAIQCRAVATLPNASLTTRINVLRPTQILFSHKLKTKVRGLSSQANYIDRATAACQQS